MTNSNLKVSVQKTSHLYFHKYKYSANGILQEVNVARGLEPHNISPKLALKKSNYNGQKDLPRGVKRITDKTEEDLIAFLKFLTDHEQIQYRVVIQRNTFHCYSNDLNFLTELLGLSGITEPHINEAEVVCNNDSLYRKNTVHNYRIYIRGHLTSGSEKTLLKRFVEMHDVKPCESLRKWLSFSSKYCHDHFFFDFNDPGLELVLEMMVPGVIKKIYKLEGNNRVE